jgi:hypothetical protein
VLLFFLLHWLHVLILYKASLFVSYFFRLLFIYHFIY